MPSIKVVYKFKEKKIKLLSVSIFSSVHLFKNLDKGEKLTLENVATNNLVGYMRAESYSVLYAGLYIAVLEHSFHPNR